ncbi:disease resistance protein PIK6-NP-like [Miscanthus floridulus]|uniref:disease resistance protein PIK6-NP-like n=1 Tax=Miscanthus floridulus TaxID=154761 RepID=UPI003459C9E4
MADLVLGVAKSLVEGTLTKALSAIEEEKNLRQSAQRDLVFITGEFQMMQSFLKAINKEHVKNYIVSTLVTQVRDLAYDVEDCIEFIIHMDTKSDWWCRFVPSCIAGTLPLDEAVAEIQQLKARVEDVIQRKARYNLLTDDSAGSSRVMEMQQPATGTAVLGMLAGPGDTNTRMYRVLEDLTRLITEDDKGLQVISVWSRGRELETASIIRNAYDDPDICRKFQFRAWVKLIHPFNPHAFIQNLLVQFYANSPEVEEQPVGSIRGISVLKRIQEREAEGHLAEFVQHMNMQKYLIVLDDMCSMVEWDAIRTYLPDRSNGSRIIVSTQHFEIASFCTGHSYFRRSSDDHSPCVFFKTVSQSVRENGDEASDTTSVNERNSAASASVDHFTLVGRESQINELRADYIMKARIGDNVISVWGTPGVGKSALVRSLYSSIKSTRTGSAFQNYAWVDVTHPFIARDFFRSLHLELDNASVQAYINPTEGCRKILKDHWSLIVIDNLQSTKEWDIIKAALSGFSKTIIVITTEPSVAFHCASTPELVFNVKCLDNDSAINVFKKVLERTEFYRAHVGDPEVPERKKKFYRSRDPELRKVVSRCGGLPKIIIAIAEQLATGQNGWHNIMGSMKDNFMHYLENEPQLASLSHLLGWMHSYFRDLPDDLRQSIAYLSIFPGDCNIRRRRLVLRWVAEGHSKDSNKHTAEENGETLFSKLVELSMIQQPCLTSIAHMRMVLYKVSAFFHEFIISRPVEENITIALEVFALKEHCQPTTQRRGRHLVIQESWDRDEIVFDNIDLMRLRSLTVFGNWKPFFISTSMKVLRVLDLENASGVSDRDVEKIVKLLSRLKFLSLRGCSEVSCLPSSLGDLRQLQILDVRRTSIVTLPKSITKLKKLQYIRAGTTAPGPGPAEEPSPPPCSFVCWLPDLCTSRQRVGVEMPTGIKKLKALHTLGFIDTGICRGKAIMKELKELTQLRKLGVYGINKKNCKEFCAAISCHVRLESLSVWLSKGNQACLNEVSLSQEKPLQNLHSLKLYGLVSEVPAWIKDLPKLTKLELEITMSEEIEVIKYLGEIKELCILRLCVKPLQDGDGKLDFCVWLNGIQKRCYKNLKILEITCSSNLNISFGSEAMQNLELLTARCCSGSTLTFMEIKNLSKQKLKEVRLIGSHDTALKVGIEKQLEEHPRNPPLKLEELEGC